MRIAAAGSPDKVSQLRGIVGTPDLHKYCDLENGEADRALCASAFHRPIQPLSRDMLFVTILEGRGKCSGTS